MQFLELKQSSIKVIPLKKKKKKEGKIERSSRAFNDDLILRSATLWRSRASIRRSHSLGKFGILAVSSFEKKAWRSLRPDLATLLLLQFYGWYQVRCTRGNRWKVYDYGNVCPYYGKNATLRSVSKLSRCYGVLDTWLWYLSR